MKVLSKDKGLTETYAESGNSFIEKLADLYNMDSKNVNPTEFAATVRYSEKIGED